MEIKASQYIRQFIPFTWRMDINMSFLAQQGALEVVTVSINISGNA